MVTRLLEQELEFADELPDGFADRHLHHAETIARRRELASEPARVVEENRGPRGRLECGFSLGGALSDDTPYNVDDVRQRFRVGEMTPERLVALKSHTWIAAGMLSQHYQDPEVEAHVRRVEWLLGRDDDELDALRRQWLSSEEYEHVQEQVAAMRDPNYDL